MSCVAVSGKLEALGKYKLQEAGQRDAAQDNLFGEQDFDDEKVAAPHISHGLLQ